MKKKLSIAALAIVLSLSSCKCAAEKGAVGRLESQQEKIFVRYTAYVNQDPKLDAAKRDDEIKLLQSLRDITGSLKRSLGE